MKKLLQFIFSFIFVVSSYHEVKACHGVALLNYQFVVGANGITINANSDPATCGCGPYYLQIEVSCTSNGLTGVVPNNIQAQLLNGTSVNAYPWFNSLLNPGGNYSAPNWVDNCVTEPYTAGFIPFANLCAGQTYWFRAREWVSGSNSGGPWTGINSFTVPSNPIPLNATITASPNVICPPQCSNLTVSNITGGCLMGGNYTVTWSNGLGTGLGPKVVCPVVTTTYTATITTPCGQTLQLPVTVTVAGTAVAGTASITPSQICASGGNVTLNLVGNSGTIQWQSSTNSGPWVNVNGATNSTLIINVNANTCFQALVSNCNQTVVSNIVCVTVSTPPTPTSVSTNITCFGFNDGTATISPTGLQYSLNGGGNVSNNIFTGLSAGNYTVVVTDANGCTGSVSFTINEPPILSLNTSSTPSNCNNADGVATVTPSGGTPIYTYQWSNSAITQTITGLLTGVYNVTVTDQNGCQQTAVVNVGLIPSTINSMPSVTNISCNGLCDGSVNLSNPTGGTAPYTYQWSNSAITQNINNLCVGNYNVIITDNVGCSFLINNINITQPSLLTINPTATPDTICIGQSTTLNSNVVGGTAGYVFNWNPTSNTNSTFIDQPIVTTNYNLQVIDNNGCVANGQVLVFVYSPIQSSANPNVTTICIGQNVNVIGSALGGNGGPYVYTWLPNNINGNAVNLSPAATTTYTMIASDGCSPNDTVTFTIVVNPLPNVIISSDLVSGCAPLTVNFSNNTVNSNCSWNIDNTIINNCNPSYTFTTSGLYNITLTVTDNNGCTNTAPPYMVDVYPIPVADFVYQPQVITVVNNIVLFTNTSQGATSYYWDFSGLGNSTLVDPSFMFPDSGCYDINLIATNQQLCSDTVEYTLCVEDVVLFYIPNAFTPQGDGVNDYFFPIVNGISEWDFYVFDRWGMEIFRGNQTNKWDGTFNNNPVQQDVYVWKIVFKGEIKNLKREYIGRVSVVR